MNCIAKTLSGQQHNIFTGPDFTNTVLTTVPGGINFLVKRSFGPLDDGQYWYEIATPQGPGWLHSGTVEVTGEGCGQKKPQDEITPVMSSTETPSEPTVEAIEPPPLVLKQQIIRIVTVVSQGVCVRSEPKPEAMVLLPGLRNGVEAIWKESTPDGKWHKIDMYDDANTQGWVNAEYTRVADIIEKQVSPNVSTVAGEVLLDVPYHSQEDADAKYAWADCGPTSLRMIIAWNAHRFGLPNPNITVDEIVRTVGIGPKDFSSFAQLIPAARKYGIEMYHTNQATLERVKRELDFGRPVVQLVRYGSFSQRQHQRFTSGHFLVVTGYNATHVYFNDPYWAGEQRNEGHNWAVPNEEFNHSIGPKGAGMAGNMPYQALFLTPSALA